MRAKIIVLSFFMFIPLAAQAEKGAFELSVGGQQYIFPPSCIKSLEYTQRDETDSAYLSFQLTKVCGDRMAEITAENMAKQMAISYQGNLLFSSMITQRLSSSFRFNTDNTSRVVLMQIIKDYGVSVE